MAISNSMSSFVLTYWLKGQIQFAILMNFVDKDGTTKVYIPVHPWMAVWELQGRECNVNQVLRMIFVRRLAGKY